jgi:ABC-type sulfate transport system permease component
MGFSLVVVARIMPKEVVSSASYCFSRTLSAIGFSVMVNPPNEIFRQQVMPAFLYSFMLALGWFEC